MPYKATIVFNGLADAAKAVQEKAQAICDAAAAAHASEMRRLLASGGAGVRYDDLPNESSAPGAAPVSQTGELADSIQVVALDEVGIGAATVVSGPAVYLEFGTSKMAPRPFVEPALQAVKVTGDE
ncbi:MAG TPA: hypothetical protein VGL56_14865 [Fimbriimonadaceae bacterium]|jgi:HK97 gp10 family phage protein